MFLQFAMKERVAIGHIAALRIVTVQARVHS